MGEGEGGRGMEEGEGINGPECSSFLRKELLRWDSSL